MPEAVGLPEPAREVGEVDVRTLYRLLGFNASRLADARCVDVVNGKVHDRRLIRTEQEFVNWAKEFNGKGNCFVGRNPRNEAKEVTGITAMSLDIDPVRPKGTSATEEQTQECIELGQRILEKYPGGSLGLSGNGVLVLWTVPHPFPTDVLEFPKKLGFFQDECQKLTDPKRIKIDATQDNARLVKVFGTLSTKGTHKPTRFLSVANRAGDGRRVFEYVESFVVGKPVAREELLAKSECADRSKNDYTLALHYKNQGLGKADILDALAHHALGRPDRRDDHVRIVEKLFGGVSNHVGGGDNASVPLGVHSPETSIQGYLEGLTARGKNKEPELQTGFRELDDATHGLRRRELYTIAARPGIGKTTILINIAARLCLHNKSVLFLSTEMAYQDIWDRLIAAETGIPGERFRNGQFGPEDRGLFDRFLPTFKTFKLNVCDSFAPKIGEVEKAVDDYKPDVLIFDHIQHIEGGEDWKVLSAFTQGLKKLAMDKNIAVLAASQLKRPFGYVGKAPAHPGLSDLKNCGRIEEESAFVLILSPTDTFYGENVPLIHAEMAKNRYGPNVTTELAFFKDTSKFKSLEAVNAER